MARTANRHRGAVIPTIIASDWWLFIHCDIPCPFSTVVMSSRGQTTTWAQSSRRAFNPPPHHVELCPSPVCDPYVQSVTNVYVDLQSKGNLLDICGHWGAQAVPHHNSQEMTRETLAGRNNRAPVLSAEGACTPEHTRNEPSHSVCPGVCAQCAFYHCEPLEMIAFNSQDLSSVEERQLSFLCPAHALCTYIQRGRVTLGH